MPHPATLPIGRRRRHRHQCGLRGTRLCIAWPEQAYIVARGEKVEDRLHALRFAGVQERAHARCTAGDVTAAMMEIERVEVFGDAAHRRDLRVVGRSEEHTSELQSLMRISYAVFCLKKNRETNHNSTYHTHDQPKDTDKSI